MAVIKESNGDAAADSTTQYTIALGDVFQGTLGPADYDDYVRVEVTAGMIYEITFTHDDSIDHGVYDLARDNRFGTRNNLGYYEEKIAFSPPVSGTYYIYVHSSQDIDQSVDYEFSLTENTVPMAAPSTGLLD